MMKYGRGKRERGMNRGGDGARGNLAGSNKGAAAGILILLQRPTVDFLNLDAVLGLVSKTMYLASE